MEQQNAAGPQDPKKERSNAQQRLVADTPMATAPQAQPKVNGPSQHGPLSNGVPAQNGDIPTTNGDHTGLEMTIAAPSQDPPPIEQEWRSNPSFNLSFGKTLDRMAQQCYVDLNENLTRMSELRSDDLPPQTNGALAPGQTDVSAASIERKTLLMNFAQTHRDRFIKSLVLSDWAGKVKEDGGRLIDLHIHLKNQEQAYNYAKDAFAILKRDLVHFKVPAPNIEGAMEVLATGKASHVPDFGYIPKKKLSAKQLLKTLRNMNVALATRLNLHEELPAYMQDYSIANGRVTFKVEGEFEVDLTIADEEVTSQFYFIDFRFKFSPASSNAINAQLMSHLEAQTNGAIAKHGLQGCYDFLHNFVLTHKINVLRGQAQDLVRGKWFDCVRVENLRRSLVVQYWATAPGPKSWFEIGVSSGKAKAGPRKKPTPTISVRWFRKGGEVKDEKLEFDWQDLSLERCLMTVIGKHVFGKLEAAKEGLRAVSPPDALLQVELPASPAPADECALTLRLPTLRKPLTVKVEPVTGQFSLSPPSNATIRHERDLKKDPNVNVVALLTSLVAALAREQVNKHAELLGWREIRNLASTREKFGKDDVHRSVFLMPGWGQQWALAVSFGLGGEKWWVVQLKDTRAPDRPNSTLKEVTAVRMIPLAEALGKQPEVSRSTLLRIEKLAVAEVSYSVLAQQLRVMRIPHQFEKPSLTAESNSARRSPNGAVYLQFGPLMRNPVDKAWKPWAADQVRLTHHGIDTVEDGAEGERASVRHDLRLSLEAGKMKQLQQHLTQRHDQDIAISSTGGLAVRLKTPFGEPFVEQIRSRLRSIERLEQYVATTQKLRWKSTFVGLSRLAFDYSGTPQLSAQVIFASNGSQPVKLKLEPEDSNPHRKVKVALEQSLNTGHEGAFLMFAQMLAFTLRPLQKLDDLEASHLARKTFSVHMRSVTKYLIDYKAPLPVCSFIVQIKTKKQEGGKKQIEWHIGQGTSNPETPSMQEGLRSALKALWSESGEGWFGVGNSIIGDSRGISNALEKVDEVVRRFEEFAEAATKPIAPAAPASADSTKTDKQKKPSQPAQPAAKATTKKEHEVITLD